MYNTVKISRSRLNSAIKKINELLNDMGASCNPRHQKYVLISQEIKNDLEKSAKKAFALQCPMAPDFAEPLPKFAAATSPRTINRV